MKTIVKNIPNLLTLINLSVGVIGILFWQHNILLSATCVFIAMIFDFFDGFSARILKQSSELGKQLDSLCDLVSFGVLPMCIMFGMLHPDFIWIRHDDIPFQTYLILIIPLFSAIRLAKFNLDEEQSFGFKGLPTPANAFWIAAVPFIVHHAPDNSLSYILFSSQTNLLILSVTTSTCLLLPLPLMALKFKNISLRENFFRYLLLLMAFIAFLLFRWTAIPLIVLLYIVISLISLILKKKEKKVSRAKQSDTFH